MEDMSPHYFKMVSQCVFVIFVFISVTCSWPKIDSGDKSPLHDFWDKLKPYLGKPILSNSSSLTPRSFFERKWRRFWPGGVIPYEVDSRFSDIERNMLVSFMDSFHQMSCVRWVERRGEYDYVYFNISELYCNSPAGKIGGMQTVNLKSECFVKPGYKGAIIHEMFHTFGFIHEHQRDDRDCYVRVTGFGLDLADIRHVFGLDTRFPYDFQSIMHYRERDYLKGRRGERLGNIERVPNQLDRWKLNYIYCGAPHYCDVYPRYCDQMDQAEEFCKASPYDNQF